MEYRWGHIASSRNIPLHQLKSRLSELDDWRDHEIVVVCETGERSKQAVEQLREAGFHRVRNLVGGARGLV
jgi:rhodanese-related sulfurtransferase